MAKHKATAPNGANKRAGIGFRDLRRRLHTSNQPTRGSEQGRSDHEKIRVLSLARSLENRGVPSQQMPTPDLALLKVESDEHCHSSKFSRRTAMQAASGEPGVHGRGQPAWPRLLGLGGYRVGAPTALCQAPMEDLHPDGLLRSTSRAIRVAAV